MFRALLWAAILPSGILCKRILNLDKVESEPAGLLWKVFLLGCLSCVPASILEAAGESIIPEDLSPTAYSVAMFFVMVPLVEEGCKFFALNTGPHSTTRSTASSTVLWLRSALPPSKTSSTCS